LIVLFGFHFQQDEEPERRRWSSSFDMPQAAQSVSPPMLTDSGTPGLAAVRFFGFIVAFADESGVATILEELRRTIAELRSVDGSPAAAALIPQVRDSVLPLCVSCIFVFVE
jgi:hypothetical protein